MKFNRTAALKSIRKAQLNIIAGVGAAALLGAVVLSFEGSATADGSPPPWAPGGISQDAQAVGGLKFFNAAGQQITGGSTTDSPFAAYAVGLQPTRTGGGFTDTKAGLFLYLPVFGQTPDQWSTNEQVGATTVFPNASSPSPISGTSLPVFTGASGDETLGGVASDFPQTSTSTGYVNAYEVRLYTSAVGHGASVTYDYSDITIDTTAHTWSQTWTPSGDFPPTGTTTPPTTPTTPPTTPTTPPTTPTTPPTTPTTPPTTPTTPPTTPTTPPTTPTTPPTTPTTPPTTPTTPPTTPTTPPTTPTTPPTTTPTTPPTTPTTPPTTPTTPPTTPTTPPTTPTTPPTTPTTPPTTPTTPPTTPTTPPTTPTTPPTTPTTPPTTPTTPPTTASTSPTSSGGTATAVDSSGQPLGNDPALTQGQAITVTADGFAAGASVDVTMHSTALDLGTVTADDNGVVTFAFTVPATAAPGAHELVFTSGATSVSFAFTVSPTGAATSSASTTPVILGHTGSDVAQPLVIGLLAVAAGCMVLVGVRRRPFHGRHS